MLRRVTDDDPRPIREVNAEIPEWLETIVLKLLAKDAEERFQSANGAAELLGEHLAHLQHPTTSPMPARVEPPTRKDGLQVGVSKPKQLEPSRSKRPIVAITFSVLAFLILAIAAPGFCSG